MLKIYLKRMIQGSESMDPYKDGYSITTVNEKGIMIKSELPNSVPLFIPDTELKKIMRRKKESDWIEIG